MVMYGIYNSDTLEQLIDNVHKMHNKTTWNEKLFASKLSTGIIGIYPRIELATMPFVFNNDKTKICQNVQTQNKKISFIS